MLKKNKETLKDIFVEAVQNYKKRKFDRAEILCRKIRSIDPNHFESHVLLADIAAKKEDYKKATELLTVALNIQPNNVNILNNLGTAYKNLGEYKKAVGYYKKIIDIDEKNPNAYYNLGAICYDLKQLNEAKKYLEKTNSIQPNFALSFFVLGNVYKDLREYNSAISNYQKALSINKNLLGAHNNLGLVYRTLNDFENAINCYKKAIEIKKDHVNANHNLALALKESGQFNEAIEFHEKAIKYEPENLAHYFYLSDLKNEVLDVNLKDKIKKILSKSNSSKNNNAYGNYLLSKYEKNKKNYKKELEHLIKGHQFYFDSKKTTFEIMNQYNFKDMIQISNEIQMEKSEKKDPFKIKPIFIIGVPRCGSTLVEKIIGSGEKYVPMGEETAVLEEFITREIMKKQSLNLGTINQNRDDITNIYKQRGLISDKFDNIFTDKSLNNFFFLKFIKEIYPESKIINCKRNILASIMSIFQNHLTELAWAHNLDNIFKYFDNYFKTIDVYEKLNPNSIYHLDYEKLVNNPIEESKKLMKFCELPWHKKCLEFYKRQDLFSKTASNVQIRQAVYKHSLDKYLPYKKMLDNYGKKYSWFN